MADFGFQTSQASGTSGIGGSGTTNYVSKFTAASTIGDSQIFDNGTSINISSGNTTIGTYTGAPTISAIYMGATPAGANYVLANNSGLTFLSGISGVSLAVNGSVAAELKSDRFNISQNVGIGLGLAAPTSALNVVGMTILKGIDATSSNFALKVENSASASLLSVRNDGNVGIGIAAPVAKLHVKSETSSGQDIFKLSSLSTVYDLLSINQSSFTSRVNTYNLFPAGVVGSGGDSVLNLKSETGGNPTLNFFSVNGTQNNLTINGSAIPVISTGFELNIDSPIVGIGLVGYAGSARLHVKGIDATSSNYALKVENSTPTNLLSVRNDGVVDIYGTITPRLQSIVSSATVTPTNLNDEVVITAQATGLTLVNPTGTAVQGQSMIIRIKDNGTARTIAYDTQYRAIGVTLPTTTVINKIVYLGLIYNSTDTKWDVIGVSQEA